MAKYQFQGHDIAAPFIIKSNEPVFHSESVSLKVSRVKQGAQRWELEFGLVMQDSSSFLPDMVNNFHTTVTMEMPQLNVRGETINQGSCTSSVSPTGSIAAGTTAIGLTGMSNGSTINKGRFVKFSNHDKIYLVTSTTIADGFGFGTLNIYPGLVSSVTGATQLLYRDGTDSITFTAYRDIDNVQGITFVDGVLTESGTINLIEAL